MRERFEADGCEIAIPVLERLVELGQLHPRVTMLIAQQTHLLAVLLDVYEIDLALVQQGYDNAYHGDGAFLDQLIDRIRSSHRQSLKLARRVAAERTLSEGMHRGDADRALKKLIEAGIIDHKARGEYHVINPLLRRRLLEGPLV